jgi:hypothetical protein
MGSGLLTFTKRNAEGDSYRIASPSSTGAGVIKITDILDEDYAAVTNKYVILNGTTTVTVTGNFFRAPRALVVVAGSSETNEGQITVRQQTDTSNVFIQMPANFGQTTIGAFTVPAGKVAVLKRIRLSIVRASGTAGSATILLFIRERDAAWRAIRVFEMQTGAPTEFTQLGGDLLPPGTDVKFRIHSVSDNNTIVDGAVEYTLRDE